MAPDTRGMNMRPMIVPHTAAIISRNEITSLTRDMGLGAA